MYNSMKTLISYIFILAFASITLAQIVYNNDNTYKKHKDSREFEGGDNGFRFEYVNTGVNSKYSDYGIGFFREKFLIFSGKKKGAFEK